MKKRDFDKINFKKVEIQKNKKTQKNSFLEEYDLQMKKFQEKEKKKVELQKRLQKEKENFLKFFNKKIGIEEIKNNFKIIILFLVGVIIFIFYLNFVTFKGDLKGEKILYVKMDGSRGSILKINNKYLKNQASIKNTKNFEYGTYLINFDVKRITTKNNYTTFDGKIIGWKESKLNIFRKYILNIFDDLFLTEDNLYAFSKAAILGEKSEVSKDMKDKFKYTGLAHLIVISGTHISLVIIGIVKLLDMISLAYRPKYIFALVILTFYCALIGFSPGILRAYIMGAMMILARILFEKEESKKSLLISFVVNVVLNPYSIFDISMQLSYMAVIAIIFVYPPIKKFFEKSIFSKIKNEILRNTVDLMFLSFVIQFTSIPLFLYYFQKLPLFSFLLNIIGVPIGTIVIQILFFIMLVNILKITFLNSILVFITKIVFGSFEGFIYAGSKIPLLQIGVSQKFSILFIFSFYIILFIIVFKIIPFFIFDKK